jgi:hypothetical protein
MVNPGDYDPATLKGPGPILQWAHYSYRVKKMVPEARLKSSFTNMYNSKYRRIYDWCVFVPSADGLFSDPIGKTRRDEYRAWKSAYLELKKKGIIFNEES